MKKILFFIGIAALLFAGCHKIEKDTYLTFEKAISADFELLKAKATTGMPNFYEFECVLNGNISVMAPKDVKILTSKAVGSCGHTVYFFDTDFVTETRKEDSASGSWFGSFTIPDPTAMAISFSKAVEILFGQTEFPVPASDKMTFRHPMGTFKNPLYIFGSNHSSYVAVDAMTGEILSLDANSSLSGSLAQE